MSKFHKQFFTNNDIKLAYLDQGEGEPIILVHGFGSNAVVNWLSTGWVQFLMDHGYRVIALDNRGHGDSEKLYNADVYTPENMASDVKALMDHLKIPKAHIMGYSMGARVSAYLALLYPQYVHSLIFGGLGLGMVLGAGSWEPVAEALLADDISTIKNDRGLMFRKFIDATKSDKKALALCVITSKKELTEQQVAQIKQPCLVIVGEKDEISGTSEGLAELMPNAISVTIPGRNHMHSVGDRIYKKEALHFLNLHPLPKS